MNKGKSEIANVEASVTAENIDTPTKSQYIGNIAAGAGGNIGFVLTPEESGPIPLVLKITYEDSNEKVQEKEISVEIFAEELPIGPDPGRRSPAGGWGGKLFPWTPVLGGTARRRSLREAGYSLPCAAKRKSSSPPRRGAAGTIRTDEEALANWNEAVNAPENTGGF